MIKEREREREREREADKNKIQISPNFETFVLVVCLMEKQQGTRLVSIKVQDCPVSTTPTVSLNYLIVQTILSN